MVSDLCGQILSINSGHGMDRIMKEDYRIHNVIFVSICFVIFRAGHMPAHIKSSTLGCSLSLPIRDGRLALGVWQGIYLGEHRNHAGSRRIVVTLQGE